VNTIVKEQKLDSYLDKIQEKDVHSAVFDRIGSLASHTVAFLASKGVATQSELSQLLYSLDSQIDKQDLSGLIRDLVSLGTVERESISLVPGGVIYTLPGKGLKAVEDVIAQYIIGKIKEQYNIDKSSILRKGPGILFDDKSILIFSERLKASSMNHVIDKIREYMNSLGNEIAELILVVRGSVAAAKLREVIENHEGFDAVNVVSAFQSSLDKMINEITISHHTGTTITQTHIVMNNDDSESIDLMDAVHEGDATSRAIKMRLWFGIIQEFVDLSNGRAEWKSILEFIETTALQSSKARSVPLTIEDGRRALTELLADEMLVALRIGNYKKIINLDKGVWIVNSVVLRELKDKAIESLKTEFRKKGYSVSCDHGYYDLCVNEKSYVVFPTQQELNTLLRLHSDIACRICNSTQVVCILTAKEYFDENVPIPSNLSILTMDSGMAEILT
jgi:DNA-binding HxlR family transcriptional regulator